MSANQDVHQTQGGASESIRLLGSTSKPTEQIDRHGETLTAFSKGIVVLEGQDRGGSKNGHLFTVIDGFGKPLASPLPFFHNPHHRRSSDPSAVHLPYPV